MHRAQYGKELVKPQCSRELVATGRSMNISKGWTGTGKGGRIRLCMVNGLLREFRFHSIGHSNIEVFFFESYLTCLKIILAVD